MAKMKQDGHGSRIAIVFNGSPLFSGGAGSGESDIRQWIIENDLLEAIIALPDQLFYNTGIFTYIWIITNRKSQPRKGKVQLINAVSFYQKMSRSLGNKRHFMNADHIGQITQLYGDFVDNEFCQIFDNDDFGYARIRVERPLRLNFQASPERLARLSEETAFQNLAKSRKKGPAAQAEIAEGHQLQTEINAMLAEFDPHKCYKDRAIFEAELDAAITARNLRILAPIRRAILNALSEPDETAAICTDSKGQPEADSNLRDYENVPLKEDIATYFEREIKPHVPDAWLDESYTRLGYEINFTRYFYQYTPLRPLADIRADILALEAETEGLLHEVLD